MARADFNDVMNFYTPLGFQVPGFLVGSLPCRFVPVQRVFTADRPFSFCVGYITYVGVGPSTGIGHATPTGWAIDYNSNDVVELQSSPGTFYQAFYTERVFPAHLPAYRRVWVI